jgi:hypothetical protein
VFGDLKSAEDAFAARRPEPWLPRRVKGCSGGTIWGLVGVAERGFEDCCRSVAIALDDEDGGACRGCCTAGAVICGTGKGGREEVGCG